MNNAVSLRSFLSVSGQKADPKKVEALERLFETLFERPLEEIPVHDPMVLRRRLVDGLKQGGSSAGRIQAYEQFFMGLARRAALDGLVSPPPEGPWTLEWQSVLDTEAGQAARTRGSLRALAGWATLRSITPRAVTDDVLREWAQGTSADAEAIHMLSSALESWRTGAAGESAELRLERLRRKAAEGTVRRESQYR